MKFWSTDIRQVYNNEFVYAIQYMFLSRSLVLLKMKNKQKHLQRVPSIWCEDMSFQVVNWVLHVDDQMEIKC